MRVNIVREVKNKLEFEQLIASLCSQIYSRGKVIVNSVEGVSSLVYCYPGTKCRWKDVVEKGEQLIVGYVKSEELSKFGIKLNGVILVITGDVATSVS